MQGWDTISRSFDVMIRDVTKLNGFFEEALDIVKDHSDELFKSDWAKLKTGSKRDALSKATERARANRSWHYKNAPSGRKWVLHWTWNLQNNTTKTIKKLSGILKYNAPYAEAHLKWWWKLPKRKFIELDPKTKMLIVKALQKKISKDIQNFNNWRL